MLSQICPSASAEAPLELLLRVFVDTLAGLHALHEARDSTGRQLRLVHGQLAREEIFVGLDGIARITNVARTSVRRDARYVGYLAPEVLGGDDAPDPRSDVYSVGVHLWEALARKRLFDGAVAGQVLAQQTGAPVPRPNVSQDMLWAVPLVEVALKALAPDKKDRFASAAEMSAEIVRAAGPGKVADAPAVGALVESLVGQRVRERREQLSVPLARSPSSSAVRRQKTRMKPVAQPEEDPDDATMADAHEADKDGDSSEIPTEILKQPHSLLLRKSEPSTTEVHPADEERTIDSSRTGVTRPPTVDEDEEDIKTVTTQAISITEKAGADYADDSVTQHAPNEAIAAAVAKHGADYQDDSVTREAMTKPMMSAALQEAAYLEDSATKKKIPALASDAPPAQGLSPAQSALLAELGDEDDLDDDSITSQAPAAVTRLLRMVAAEVNEAKQRRVAPRPAAGAPAQPNHVVAMGRLPAGPALDDGSPPSIPPVRASRSAPTEPPRSARMQAGAPEFPAPASVRVKVGSSDALANTVNALAVDPADFDTTAAMPPPVAAPGGQLPMVPLDPAALHAGMAPPPDAVMPSSIPTGGPMAHVAPLDLPGPYDVDPDAPPPTPRKYAVIVVGVFIASAVFCLVAIVNSFSSKPEGAAPRDPPKSEEAVVEGLAPPPFAPRKSTAKTAPSAKPGVLKKHGR
jgi:hypothetical protein